MDFSFPEKLQGHQEIIVQQKDTASNFGSGLIDVYATPAMVGLMEGTAHQSITPFLPQDFISLGIEINVKHLKATAVGEKVECFSTLIEHTGRKLLFEIKAFDSKGLIGKAQHWRYIVNATEFLQKLSNA